MLLDGLGVQPPEPSFFMQVYNNSLYALTSTLSTSDVSYHDGSLTIGIRCITCIRSINAGDWVAVEQHFTKDIAKVLGVTPTTVRAYFKDDKFPDPNPVYRGRQVLYYWTSEQLAAAKKIIADAANNRNGRTPPEA